MTTHTGQASPLSQMRQSYGNEDAPLGGYAALIMVFATLAGAGLCAGRKRLPERIAFADLALLTMATQGAARIVTRDKVTSVLRAPLTRYQRPAGGGEVDEQATGHGLHLALGQLVTCPYCLSQWIALGFVAAFVAAPRQTRVAAAVVSIAAASDYLQAAYSKLSPDPSGQSR
jgi:hypothetical protein